MAVPCISFFTWMDGLFPRDIVSFCSFVGWSFFLTGVCRSCELWPEVFLGSLGLNLFEWGAQALFCKNAFMKGPLLKFWNSGEYISAVLRYKVTANTIAWHYLSVFPLLFLRWTQLAARKKKKKKSFPNARSTKSASNRTAKLTCVFWWYILCACNLIKIFVAVWIWKEIMLIFLYVNSKSGKLTFL